MSRRKKEDLSVEFPINRLELEGALASEQLTFMQGNQEYAVEPDTGEVLVVRRTPPPAFVTTTFKDKDGNVLREFTRGKKFANGGGFVISYTAKMCEFLEKCSTGSIVRVFLYIAHNQQYGNDGKTFGWRASHKYLRQVLHMDKSTVWDALKYLKDNYLVHVGKIEGYTEFMVNPNYVTIGQDKQARQKEWNRRWSATLKN